MKGAYISLGLLQRFICLETYHSNILKITWSTCLRHIGQRTFEFSMIFCAHSLQTLLSDDCQSGLMFFWSWSSLSSCYATLHFSLTEDHWISSISVARLALNISAATEVNARAMAASVSRSAWANPSFFSLHAAMKLSTLASSCLVRKRLNADS